MIESLKIRDFQKHQSLDLALDPHVTTLVGPSNAGKTSTLRALKWLCHNRPQGDAFIRHGQERAKVVVKVDGRQVVRIKGNVGNIYCLNKKRYEAFGAGVPDEIVNLLNLSDLNWSSQHDSPFWFFLSAGEVSRELNGIVDLSLIDSALANIASEVRRAKSTVEVSRDRLRIARERMDALAWAKDCDAELRKVEELQEATDLSKRKIDGLRTILDKMVHVKASIVLLKTASEELEEILSRAELATETSQKEVGLRTLLGKVADAREESCRLKESSMRLQNELNEAMKGKCPACGRQ